MVTPKQIQAFLATVVCLLSLGFSPVSLLAAPYQQDAGTDGLLSIEVEDFDANVSQGGHSWTDTFPSGYSGTGALEATPNIGTNNNTGYVTSSPRLDYTVNFVKTGVHYVWVRGAGPTGNDDSLHVGLDGAALTSSNRISAFSTALGWTNTQMGGTVATINVSAPGEHTLNVWMREDGTLFDKLVLTTNSAYTVTGAGPPVSPRGSATVAAVPVTNPTGGTFTASVSVSLTTTTVGGGIYYTTDGSTPDINSALYGGTPLVFTADTTLKAITIASGLTDSAITMQVYTIVPSGGTGAIQQDAGTDGLLSIGVEDFDANVSQGGHSWTDTFPSGYSGAGALEATPNIGTNNNTGYVTSSPRLDYTVNFVKTGVHYVWVRGAGPTGNDDSLHVGLDGAALTSSNRISAFSTALGWTNTQMGGTVATINVSAPGEHTLNVWMREDGTLFDKLVLTTNSAYTVSGTGPPASPRGSGGPATLFVDDFSDGDALGWTVVNSCIKGVSSWSVVGNVFMQTGSCRGFSTEGVAIGTHALSDTGLPADVDIQLRMRSQHPDSDAVASNNGDSRRFGASGVVFGYQDENNHYRFEFSGVKGHRKLWRKQGGVFTELNTSPQSYVQGQWVDVRILFQNGLILVFVDGQQVMAAADSAFSSGQLGLFCARNASCSFDDIVVTGAPAGPEIGLNLPDSASSAHASSEYFVNSDGSLDVSILSSVASGIGGAEFVMDEGSGGELIQTVLAPPYSTQFILSPGEHSVAGYLLDSSGIRLAAPEASVTLPQIGLGGIHLYCLGDSITTGLGDDIPGDDISVDNRNTGGGYAPVLNDYLSADNGVPATVLNDGNPGEESWEGAARITAVLARTPEVQAYLAFYGANDSGGSTPQAPGLGLNRGDNGYAGSFKDYMQQIVDAVVTPPPAGAGKLIFLAKAPPYLADATRNALVAQYNQVIDEIVAQLKIDYPASYVTYTPADFYSHFTTNPAEIGPDGVHPVGTGYQSMARLWCEALNGQQGWLCIP